MEIIRTMFEGRIGNGAYILRSLIATLIFGIFYIAREHISVLYYVVWLVSNFYITALSVRRLHDIGHKGYLAALCFVPGIGEFFMLYLWLKKGEARKNIYGDIPC